MNSELAMFERLQRFLKETRFMFCFFYCENPDDKNRRLKWRFGSSYYLEKDDDYHRVAEKFKEVAEYCFARKCTLICNEGIGQPNVKRKKWLGFTFIKQGNAKTPPVNQWGQHWWRLIVGDGAVGAAGYVVVIKISANDVNGAKDCIARIQEIVRGEEKGRAEISGTVLEYRGKKDMIKIAMQRHRNAVLVYGTPFWIVLFLLISRIAGEVISDSVSSAFPHARTYSTLFVGLSWFPIAIGLLLLIDVTAALTFWAEIRGRR